MKIPVVKHRENPQISEAVWKVIGNRILYKRLPAARSQENPNRQGVDMTVKTRKVIFWVIMSLTALVLIAAFKIIS